MPSSHACIPQRLATEYHPRVVAVVKNQLAKQHIISPRPRLRFRRHQSPNNTPLTHNTPPTRLLALAENVPEPQRLVARARDDDSAIRAHAQV